MAELPRHPDTDEVSTDANHRSSHDTPWGTYVFLAVVAVAVLAMIVLHLTGVVGPGADAR
jgi:hypothetical protein